MKLSTFKELLDAHRFAALEFVFDDGETIPAQFHVTEVGHVRKNFIDCGGTRRVAESCQLQVWVSPRDPEHRLHAGKLASILELARDLVPSEDLPVEVEYEGCVVSQYEITESETRDGLLRFHLRDKHTDCLAKDACGVGDQGCGSEAAGRGGCC